MNSRPFRILVTRTDRLGDVMLATPVLRELKRLYPEAQITFLVRKEWMPVLQYGSAIELMEYDPNESTDELSLRIREKSFDRAYVIRDEKKVTVAVKRAGIRERVGPYSSLRSFFSFNRGRLQNRSRCRMHEAEYNLDLVRSHRPAISAFDLPRSWVETSAEAKVRAQEFLIREKLSEKQFFVIHPGSSGSTRYVKEESLQKLAALLIKGGQSVLITGGPIEDELLDRFKRAVPEVTLLGNKNSIGLDGMAEVYRHARTVIAHGTGPLHLAAAVGAPVFAIFSPIFVLSEKRWGPLVANRGVWVPPNVPCPAVYRCHGEKCRYYDCMDRFEVNAFLKTLEKLGS